MHNDGYRNAYETSGKDATGVTARVCIHLEFGSEEMSGEAELTGARVEGGQQLVGHGVAVGLEEVGGVVGHLAAVVAHREAPRVRHARLAQPRVPSATTSTKLFTFNSILN